MVENEIELQAAQWLAQLERGDTSAAVEAAFVRWKAADERHFAAYARLAATWQALDRLRALQPPRSAAIQQDYLKGAQQKMGTGRARGAFAVAAGVILASSALWIWRSQLDVAVYSTTKGGFQRIVLNDESAVELNTDTMIRVKLSSKLRKIDLVRGEAGFEVAHDVTRPFVVSAGSTAVLAVGTRFNVRKFDTSVEVTVDEGKVLVDTAALLEKMTSLRSGTSPLVMAGQVAMAGNGGIKLSAVRADAMARKLAWQNQMLAFDDEPLSEIVKQFNRYNTKQLLIADPRVAALKVGGYFKPTNVDVFVDVLESSFGVHTQIDGVHLVLSSIAQK